MVFESAEEVVEFTAKMLASPTKTPLNETLNALWAAWRTHRRMVEGVMRSLWWLAMALLGSGLVATGAVVHAMRPYYRLLTLGCGIGLLVLAVLAAAATARSNSAYEDDD